MREKKTELYLMTHSYVGDDYQVLALLEGPTRQNVWSWWDEFNVFYKTHTLSRLHEAHRKYCNHEKWEKIPPIESCPLHKAPFTRIMDFRKQAGLNPTDSKQAHVRWLMLTKGYTLVPFREQHRD